MLKRLMSLLLVLTMVITMLPVSALAEETVETQAQETIEATEAPAEETTEAAEETTAPSEETTAPSEEPTQETEAPSEPEPESTEAVTVPVETETVPEETIGNDAMLSGTEAASGTCGDNLTWILDSEGTLTISGTGAMADYTSSSTAPWYNYINSIKHVVIEEGVTDIGECAFYRCYSMESISLPDGITEIGTNAFHYCLALTNVVLPDSVNVIDNYAFRMSGLNDISIPQGVTVVGRLAFTRCDSLKSVYISSSVTSIGDGAFEYCPALETITVDQKNQNYVSLDGVLFDKDCQTLLAYPGGRAGAYTVPDGVGRIDFSAFYIAEKLTSITIPESVHTIGVLAFDQCSNLAEIIFRGDAPAIDSTNHANTEVFYGVTATAYYPEENSTWTDEIMQKYGTGATLTWAGYDGNVDYANIIVDYIDNSPITINSVGYAFAYYTVEPYDEVRYQIDTATYEAQANENGIVQIPLGYFDEEGETEITIRFVSVGDTVIIPKKKKTIVVTVDPLTFEQEWNFSFDAKASAEISGGVGLEAGAGVAQVKAEATLGKAGVSGSLGATLNLKRSMVGDKMAVELSTDKQLGVGAEFSHGISGKICSPSFSLISANADVDASVTGIYGMYFPNFTGKMAQKKAIGVFFLGEVLNSLQNNCFLRAFFDYVKTAAYKNAGCDVITGSGAGASASAGADLGAVKINDTQVFSLGSAKIAASVSGEQKSYGSGRKSKEIKYVTEANLTALNTKILQDGIGCDILGKDTKITAQIDDELKSVASESLSAATTGDHFFLLGQVYNAQYDNYVFQDGALEELVDESKVYNAFVNGNRKFLSVDDFAEFANQISTSSIPVEYNRIMKAQSVFSCPIVLGASLGAGVKLDVDLSYKTETNYEKAAGYAKDNQHFLNFAASYSDAAVSANVAELSDTSGLASAVDANAVELQELIASVFNSLLDDIVSYFTKISGEVKEGVKSAWAWIGKQADSVKDWVVSLTYSENGGGAWSLSYDVDVQSVRLRNSVLSTGISESADESGELEKGSTIGRPIAVSVEDTSTGEEITDLSEEPLEFTIRYAVEDLEAAGLRIDSPVLQQDGIAMYRYSDSGDFFEYVGGNHDPETMTVTATITKTGQYVLAVDACAPSLSYLDISDFRTNPTITAYVDDMTGLDLSRFVFALDGDTKVDGESISDHYNPEAGIFTYTVPEGEDLAEGEHTMSFTLADTTGNSETYQYSFNVDLTAPVISDTTVVGFTNKGSAVEIRAQVSDPNLTNVYAVFSKRLPDGTWSEEVPAAMGDMGNGLWGLDYEGDGCSVRVYVKAMDIGENSATSETFEVKPFAESISIPCEYIAMYAGQEHLLQAEVAPAELETNVEWSSEDNAVATVSEDGIVTAEGVGTTYIVATVFDGKTELTARCRVDVAEAIELDGVQLSTTKLTSELYSTNYAEFDLLLKLPQNMNFQSAGENVIPESNRVAIEDVRFETEELNQYFDLIALDDRRIAVVPTDYAVENPSEVAKSYKSKVTVVVQGEEYTTEELTLTLKQTKPKLKATVPAFNSFYTGQTQEIKVTGGTVTGITLDPNKTQPDWLTLNADGTLSLNENGAQKSGKVYLLVETEEWRIPTAVTLTVKNARKTPGLKLSATSVKMTADAADSSGIALKLLPKSKKDSLAALKVEDLASQTAGYTVTGFDAETGAFILNTDSGFVPGKVTLNVSFNDTNEVLPLTVKVSVQAVSLKLSAKTITLNKALDDSAVVTVTAAPADYVITSPVIEGNENGQLAITYENGKLTILPTDAAEAGKTYKLSISAGGSKKAALTVKVIDAAPSLTLKAQSSVDLSFPDKTAAVTATVKNYASGTVTDYTAVITAPDGTVSDDFTVTRNGSVFMIRCNNTDISTGTYKLNLKLTLPEGTEVENTVKLTVKRTAVKLKLSPSKLTLNSTIDDKASVSVTCATKGYDFTRPIWELKAKNGKDSAEGALDIGWDNGKLTIAVNDNTEPGATYKLLVKANAYAPAATLTITIPTEAKSVIKSSLKAKGAIDVIRAGTSVVLTPGYKNAAAAGEETLNIYSSADNYAEPVNDLFNIEKDDQGRYVLTAAKGLDHSRTYKAELVTEFEGIEPVKSALTKFTVKMGSAKLTLKADGNILFGNDCHSRIGFTFSAKDAALNAVQEVTIKADKKGYDQMLEVIDLGNGEFAIGFKDETVDRSLLGKTITVTLNIRLNGNETAKVNTTAKMKLTVLK